MREVAQHVMGGLVLYGAIWAIENSELGQERMVAGLGALAEIGRQWVSPLWLISLSLLVLAGAGALAARFVRAPRALGLDRADVQLLLGGLAKLLLRGGLVGSLAAAGISVMAGDATWGVTLVAASALIAVRWMWRSARRFQRFWNPGIY